MYEWGFFVKPGRIEEVKEWLAEKEAAFDEATPPGLTYLGTFLPIWAEDPRCDLYQIWSWRRRGPDFDLRSAAHADRSRFAELAAEFLAFVDEGRSGEETFRLHRRVVDDPATPSQSPPGTGPAGP
ncbi:MAG TPA: hypothetical protein VK088_03205 [Acidimicrobiia bacterium]|nr:hypothetical protein [Acidimicrobiia bacterium]